MSRRVYFHRPTVGPCEDRLGIGPPRQTLEPLARNRCSKVSRFVPRLVFGGVLRSRCTTLRAAAPRNVAPRPSFSARRGTAAGSAASSDEEREDTLCAPPASKKNVLSTVFRGAGARDSIDHFTKRCGPPEYHLRSTNRLKQKKWCVHLLDVSEGGTKRL